MNKHRASSVEGWLWQPATIHWFCLVFGISLVYAMMRYHFSSGVAWHHLPLFIFNKEISLAAMIFIACFAWVSRIQHPDKCW